MNVHSMSKSIRGVIAVVGIASLVALGAVGSANATETKRSPEPLGLVGFDTVVAAAHGFEVRTDINGYKCSIPQNSPPSLCPSDFRLGEANQGKASTYNTVRDTCGYSYLYWTSSGRGYETGYYINASAGFALTHTWSLFFTTTSGPELRDHSGIAPWGGRSWSATGTLDGGGQSGSASGTVFLNNGGICVSKGPVAN